MTFGDVEDFPKQDRFYRLIWNLSRRDSAIWKRTSGSFRSSDELT